MNIYFHIDELNRDAIVASALRKKFAAIGHRLVYGNRVTNRLLNHFHNSFDLIIMPRPHLVYDNWSDRWMGWHAKFVMLSTESLGIICKDHKVMARTLLERDYLEGKRKYVERIDAFCLWGEKQLKALREHAPEVVSKCHVVGHPRHDRLCYTRREKLPDSRKKRIGIITRAVGLNDYFGRCALDGFSTILDDHFQYEFFNKKTGEKLASKRPAANPAEALIVQAIDAASTLKVVAALDAAGHDVVIRPHPKENAEAWNTLLHLGRLRAKTSNPKMPIADWLGGLDYAIGPPSTSFYDALIQGVTPISIGHLDVRREQFVGELWEDNNRLMPHIFKPKSVVELLDYIDTGKMLASEGGVAQILFEEAGYPECEKSLDKVVAICESLLSERTGDQKKSYRPILFEVVRAAFCSVWKLKNLLTRRKENSAMFAMDRRTIRFIDSLSSR